MLTARLVMADGDENVKTLHMFSPIQARQNAIIKRIKLSRRRDVILVSSGDEFLHFLEGEKLLKTVRFPTPLLCAEFICCCDDQKLIFALTKDGKTWAVPIPAKKTKKSKCNKLPTNHGEGSKSSDQDIFSGLLTGSGPVSANRQPDNVTSSEETSIVDVSSGSLVLFEPNAESFVCIGENLITCGRSESGRTLSLYVRTDSKSGKLIYPALPTFRTTLPVPNKPSSIYYERRDEELTYAEFSKSSLLCILPADATSSYNCLHLKNELFGQLFGRDVLLLCSPVLLIGCAEGQIYFLPLTFPQPELMTLQGLETSRGGNKECVTFSPKLLYDLEQDLSAIHLVNLFLPSKRIDNTKCRNAPDERTCSRKEASTASTNTLLFVGSRGKVVLAQENCSVKAAEFGVNYTVYSVPGPVLCSCMSSKGDVLVHSTGHEIFVTKLCPDSSTTSSSTCVTQSDTMLTHFTPKWIMIPYVCAIHSGIKPQKHRPVTGVDEKDQILALTFKGRLLEFRLNSSEEAEASASQRSSLFTLTPDMAAKKIKETLRNIEEVSKQLSKVKLTTEAEDEILKEVNIAINIICDTMANSPGFGFVHTEHQPEARRKQMPITCTLNPVVGSFDGIQSCSVMLQCIITNQGKRHLSDHWQLLLQLRGYKQWLSSEESHYITLNHSISLGRLNPGSSRELIIPLHGDFDVMFSVSVEAFLLCDLHSLLARAPDDLFRLAMSVQNVGNAIVPVTRKMFDALYFLRSHLIPTGSSRAVLLGSLDELVDSLKTLNSLPRTLNFQTEDKPGPKKMVGNLSGLQQIQSASLQLSQDCLDHVKALSVFKESLTAKEMSELTTEQALFLFLFADSDLTTQQVGRNCSLITMVTVNGEAVTLHLRNLSDTPAVFPSASKSSAAMGGVELTIRSVSVQLLSCVHEAVLRRLEPVISRSGNRRSNSLHHIQKALDKLENLREVSASISDTLSNRQSQVAVKVEADSTLVMDVWQLYQQLRQVQLILP